MDEKKFYNQLLELPSVSIDKVIIEKRKIEISCHTLSDSDICPICRKSVGVVHQYTERRLQDLSISGKEVWLTVRTKQYYCESCHRYFNESLDFADPSKSYTHRQAKWIFELCAQTPQTEVAALVNLSHKTVENIYFTEAQKRIDLSKRYENVRKIGIDELSFHKGKKSYCCVITDLDRNIQLDVLLDRKKETIETHFKSLGTALCNQIEVVACDIWDPYINAAKNCFPNAEITIDRFHVIKQLNSVLDNVRKEEKKNIEEKDIMNKVKWRLFKRPENCTSKDTELLLKAFEKSPILKQLYDFRNDFNRLYDKASGVESMAKDIDDWIGCLNNKARNCWAKFISTITSRKDQIVSYAKTHVTNAVTEGLNNRIRHLVRISYGIPNFDHFRLRVLTYPY